MRDEIKPKLPMPLMASISHANRMTERPSNVVSPLTLERFQRHAARMFVQQADDPAGRFKLRADTFSAHLKRFLENGGSELVTASRNRAQPHVAAMVQQGLKNAGKDAATAQVVNAAANALNGAFTEAQRAVVKVHDQWQAGGRETHQAREMIESIGLRVHAMGMAAIRFMDHVGDAGGNRIGVQARAQYEGFMQVMQGVEGVVVELDHADREDNKPKTRGPSM